MQRLFAILTIGTALTVNSSVNAAGFEGVQVTAIGYCCTSPTESNRVTVPVTKIVESLIEFPSGSIQAINGDRLVGTDIDIGTSTIAYNFRLDVNYPYGLFNGIVYDFSGPNLPTIVGVSLDPRSSFAASQVGLSFDTDTVRINVPGLRAWPGALVLVDVEYVPNVPEPETYTMLLAGLGLVSFMARRRKISST
ncbi:PEP-CTERM sorting domain-containing protein [Nitrosospira sp. Nsp13]|jgi:hypothetical protein|uniref:PEP-CTERM sorting domain-containing protein n=1 Tax=Nitrosospira sp. Nsp13 TaxID=1855332 RepID=UPI00088A39D9|nr:PEP-CTERM sorting domain-containing protein [Nitrosospira sp. Nsp13]SCX77050.1 PEP-CTERM protein-sorting domain-containing protein [Nitrosospira sp. Nsp13]